MKWAHAIPLPSEVTSPEGLAQLVERAENDLQAKLDADPRLGAAVRLKRESTGESLKIISPWINGDLFFTPTHLHIEANLGLAAWAFRGQIENILKSWIATCQIL